MRRLTDPLLNSRFVLELGFIQVAGFSEVSGLMMEAKVYEYREGGRNSHSLKFPDVGSIGNITLKRGILADTTDGSSLLFDWLSDVASGTFDPDKNPNQRGTDSDTDIVMPCAIVLLDEMGNQARRWVLFRVFPVKWSGPDMKAMASEVAIESLELACEGIEVQ